MEKNNELDEILKKAGLAYIPETHRVLRYQSVQIDLTAGNCHGKKKDIVEMELLLKIEYQIGEARKKELYKFGFQYYKKIDENLQNKNDEELLKINEECNKKHQLLCSLTNTAR